jgi:hypothetical protein
LPQREIAVHVPFVGDCPTSYSLNFISARDNNVGRRTPIEEKTRNRKNERLGTRVVMPPTPDDSPTAVFSPHTALFTASRLKSRPCAVGTTLTVFFYCFFGFFFPFYDCYNGSTRTKAACGIIMVSVLEGKRERERLVHLCDARKLDGWVSTEQSP